MRWIINAMEDGGWMVQLVELRTGQVMLEVLGFTSEERTEEWIIDYLGSLRFPGASAVVIPEIKSFGDVTLSGTWDKEGSEVQGPTERKIDVKGGSR